MIVSAKTDVIRTADVATAAAIVKNFFIIKSPFKNIIYSFLPNLTYKKPNLRHILSIHVAAEKLALIPLAARRSDNIESGASLILMKNSFLLYCVLRKGPLSPVRCTVT